MIQKLFAFGSNFNYLDSTSRGRLTIDYEKLANHLKETFPYNFISLNTCNRSEIYGVGDINKVQQHVWQHMNINESQKVNFFTHTGEDAVEHIFKVVCGLNSQIIGDNEIAGQFRKASMRAKENKVLDGFLEKMVNICLQAAKEIKNSTQLSDGTKSVAYATLKYIKSLNLPVNAAIVVVGTGSIGKAVIRNIKQYLPEAKLYISNRTEQKALAIAKELNATSIPFENLHGQLSDKDVIISCVSLQNKFLFDETCVFNPDGVHIIDLCVPASVNENLSAQSHIRITSIDTISKELTNTFEKRNNAIPDAELIMQKHINEFISWSKVYQNKQAISIWNQLFDEASSKCPFLSDMHTESRETLKNKSIGNLVEFIRQLDSQNLQPDKIIDQYKTISINHSSCTSAYDCITNRLNCSSCHI